MQKLDRLGWVAGIAFRAYGLHIGVRVTDPVILPRIVGCLPFGWEPSEDPEVDYLYSFVVGGTSGTRGRKRFHVVYSDVMRLERTERLDLALGALQRDLHLFVGEMARGRVFVHAGVVGWNGKAVVIPGPTLSGKSTLVAALVRAGAAYYSDEFAVFDERGLVYPFARPLSLRCDGSSMGRPVPAEALGGTVGTLPLPVGLVVVTSYRPGAVWHPEPLTPGASVLALLSNSLSARRQPRVVVPVLETVASSASALAGERGEAEELAGILLSHPSLTSRSPAVP